MSWLLSLLASVALAQSPVLATVDGDPITQADLDGVLSQLGDEERAQVAGQEAVLIEQIALTRVIAGLARAQGLDATESGQARVRLATEQALAQVAVEAMFAERLTDARVKEWYEAHRVQFQEREARARHVLVASEEEARVVLAELAKGGDFTGLAARYSQDPGSAENGGELGWFAQDRMVPEFADAVFGAKAGSIVGPVRTQFGWHVISVDGFRDEVPLADVAPQIRSQLEGELLEEWLDEVKGKARIEMVGAQARTLLQPATATPTVPADAPRFGAAGAAVSVVVFSDLQCPHCARAHSALRRLAESRADVEVVFRHYPIASACNPDVSHEGHPYACVAARAVVCTPKQAPALIDALFENRAALDDAVVRTLAAEYGGKGKKWEACMTSPATDARLSLDQREAHGLGVQGTPTIYVGMDGKWWLLDARADDLPEALRGLTGR